MSNNNHINLDGIDTSAMVQKMRKAVQAHQSEMANIALTSQINSEPLDYEDSIFSEMADDMKQPLEKQIDIMQEQLGTTREQLDVAISESRKADQRASDAEKEASEARKLAKQANWIAVGSFVLGCILSIILHVLG